MKFSTTLFVFITSLCSFTMIGQEDVFSEIELSNASDIAQLAAEGFAVDHPNIDENNSIKLFVSETELQRLEVLGIPHT
ncbi:MAG: hypothetical protein ACI849_000457, partial [Patiriisocius sp.]